MSRLTEFIRDSCGYPEISDFTTSLVDRNRCVIKNQLPESGQISALGQSQLDSGTINNVINYQKCMFLYFGFKYAL